MGDLYNDLLVELECPVCTNYMAPPIRQCETGHSICQICRLKLPKCPLCQGSFTESKNLSLEALACKMKYPCTNKSLGCEVKLALHEKETHEKHCSFTGYKCAMDRCSWAGKLEDIVQHWTSKKIKSKTYADFNICHTKIKSETYYANLVQAYDQLFWFKCKLERGIIFWAIQFLGNKDNACKYYYEIEVFKPGFPKRKILFSDYCQAIDIANCDLFREGACVTASVNSLSRFTGEDQLLIYYMRVHVDKKDQYKTQESNVTRRNPKKNAYTKVRDRSRGSTSQNVIKNQYGYS